MSTENEDTAAPTPPQAPSVPPVPVAAPSPGHAEGVPAEAPEVQAPVQDRTQAHAQAPAQAPAQTSDRTPVEDVRPSAAPVAEGYPAAPAAPAPVDPRTQPLPYAEAATQQLPPAGPATRQLPTTPPEPPTAPAPAAAHTGDGRQPGAEAGGWPPPPPAVPSYAGGAGHGAGPGGPYDGGQGGPYGGGQGGGPGWGAPLGQEPAPRRKGRGGLVAAALVAALVAGGIGGAIGYQLAKDGDSAGGSTTVSAGITPKDLKREPGSVAGLAAKALPSVVTIEAQGGDGEGGTGTGFVYDQQGHILTNNHVVASAADGGKLSATFSNGKRYEAEVIGRAQGYDVAVLKLKNPPAGLAPLPLGDSDKVAVGDSTIAIGAPFGLSNTVTTGIVSAKNRPVASGDGQTKQNSYMSALQTDASINPGNSGGPLLDGRGAVIGINSAIQSAGSGGFGGGQAGSIGLGFAIPINQAKNVAEQLIKSGKPVYPVIGVSVDMQAKTDGAKISDQGAGATELVDPNGPAGKAGLKPGDVITQFGGKPIDSGPTLISEIWTYKPGDVVKVTYLRGGKQAVVDLTLGSRVGDK